jgi:putative membrane protein
MKIRALAIITALALPALATADDQKNPPATAVPTDNKTPTDPKAPPASDTKTTDTTTPGNPGTKTGDKAAKLGDADVKIVAHLNHVNKMEIDLGKLAQKSGTEAVKNYGSTLVSDHQSANKELLAFTKMRKLATIPADKPETNEDKQAHKDMQTKMANLKKLKGAEFDREFLTMMIADHDKELAKIDVAMGSAADPDLKTLLTGVKPVLQRHADQARDLQKNAPQASTMPAPGNKNAPQDSTQPAPVLQQPR